MSVTVTGPAAASGPALCTASVYVPCPPTVKSPLCALVIERSAAASTFVGSLAESSAGVASGEADDTCAVLVTAGSAADPGSTASVTSELEPAASEALCVQVTVCPTEEHVHPVPVPDTYDNPAGSESDTVIGPADAAPPVFVTERS